MPRHRDSFTPLLIPKHERGFTDFDDKIVAMFARGMTVREIQGFLADQYGTVLSPDFISSVTDAVTAARTPTGDVPRRSGRKGMNQPAIAYGDRFTRTAI